MLARVPSHVPLLLLAGLLMLGNARLAAQATPGGLRFLNPPTLPPTRGYSHVVAVPAGARTIYVSGQVPLDRRGSLVGPGDFRRQAEQVFANLEAGLAATGATMADLVKLTFYVRDMGQLASLRDVRDRHVNAAAPPASTLVEVRALFRDDVLLEVDAVAAVTERTTAR